MEILRIRFANGEPAAPLRRSARSAVQQTMPECDADVVEDLLLTLTELVQNVDQHTRSAGELVISTWTGGVLIEVQDHDPVWPRLLPCDGRRDGGRGLQLISGMAQDWGVRANDDGKAVWARFECAA